MEICASARSAASWRFLCCSSCWWYCRCCCTLPFLSWTRASSSRTLSRWCHGAIVGLTSDPPIPHTKTSTRHLILTKDAQHNVPTWIGTKLAIYICPSFAAFRSGNRVHDASVFHLPFAALRLLPTSGNKRGHCAHVLDILNRHSRWIWGKNNKLLTKVCWHFITWR